MFDFHLVKHSIPSIHPPSVPAVAHASSAWRTDDPISRPRAGFHRPDRHHYYSRPFNLLALTTRQEKWFDYFPFSRSAAPPPFDVSFVARAGMSPDEFVPGKAKFNGRRLSDDTHTTTTTAVVQRPFPIRDLTISIYLNVFSTCCIVPFWENVDPAGVVWPSCQRNFTNGPTCGTIIRSAGWARNDAASFSRTIMPRVATSTNSAMPVSPGCGIEDQ